VEKKGAPSWHDESSPLGRKKNVWRACRVYKKEKGMPEGRQGEKGKAMACSDVVQGSVKKKVDVEKGIHSRGKAGRGPGTQLTVKH